MNVQMFLLVGLLICALALLCAHGWPQPGLVRSRAAAKGRTTLPRLRHRRAPPTIATPVVSPPSPSAGSAPLPVPPWREMKSRRGAPKRISPAGFACPNGQCSSFGNTNAPEHALVGDGNHGHAERIQSFRCQACRTTFSARRDTPLYQLKPPSQKARHGPDHALAEGLDPPPLARVAGLSTSHAYEVAYSCSPCTLRRCTNEPSAISTSHPSSWTNCAHGPLWTTFLPVRRRGRNVRGWQVAAGLIYGQVQQSSRRCRAGAGHIGDAPLHSGDSQSCLTGIGLLWQVEHRLY
jgi:hypothetical protein